MNRLDLARGLYEAFAAGDRDSVEARLTDDFTFSSPVDVGWIARDGACERVSDRRRVAAR